MAFDGRVYRVLIASPSDVEEERELAVRVIQDWNNLHSATRRVVVLPLRWETHTAPTYGIRPQEAINNAIVDQCDLLVGIFWTRIGSPTGEAESGTLEEITRVAKGGKPVMLYFSRVPADPDSLDLEQVARLKAFKKETYPNALVENYKSHVEFRDKLYRQIEMKIRELEEKHPNAKPPLEMSLLAVRDGKVTREHITNASIEIPNIDGYEDELAKCENDKEKLAVVSAVNTKLREMATIPLVISVENVESYGIRNLFIELRFESKGSKVEMVDASKRAGWDWLQISGVTQSALELGEFLNDKLVQDENAWVLNFSWDAIQPKRMRIVSPQLNAIAGGDAVLSIKANVYADGFADPLPISTSLDIKAIRNSYSMSEFLPDVESVKKAKDVSSWGQFRSTLSIPPIVVG